ncbi:MAG: antibiotic biosynthesis regulator FhaA [Ktedonobacteraceae bacterium]
MNARQNPLTRFEAFIQRMVEGPFARLFPQRLEPVEIQRKLERALEDNTRIQGEGRRLAPNIYDIYLSIKDHQQMVPSQNMLISEWQNNLVEYARHHHYTLRTVPILRLHAESSLRAGLVRIATELADRQNGGPDGIMATQALSAEQLAQIRTQLPQGAQLPGIPSGPSSPSQPAIPAYPGSISNSNMSAKPSAPLVTVPPAQLIIRLPQANQQTYRIEKPIINIGRQLSNDIIVEDKRVSRYHAQIKYQADGQFAIFDLGSTNGITINGTPGMRQHTLRNGDRFTIGSYDFNFERR